MEINVNDNVLVELNKKGKLIWKNHAKEVSKIYSDSELRKSTYNREMSHLEGDVLDVQLWKLMKVFGEYMSVSEKPPFTFVKTKKGIK